MHPRAADVFDEAIEIPSAQRAAWLDSACAGDNELRHEVEYLLRADAKAGTFLEKSPPLPAAMATAHAPAGKPPPSAFGPFRVVRRLGEGGMGEVWLAERHDGEFEQRVAVKQVAFPTPGLLHRFRRERRILARLEHPNIARLIDGNVDADGAPWLAMEYVEGEPISSYAGKRALDVPTRLRLFLCVCDAVQYAHRNLVVHRDLKPSNILVAADGTPKLLDFGIAKVITSGEDSAEGTATTLLTPDYAAPEQWNGGAITTATDVYALGGVLYQLLTGISPRKALASSTTTPAHAPAIPLPSSVAALADTATLARTRLLAGDLDRIVLTALATEPSQRYVSVEALAADIRNWIDGRPISVRADSKWYRVRKFAIRNRYALAAAVLVVVVCIAAALVSQQQATHARAQARRALAMQEFLTKVIRQANPEENAGEPISPHQLIQKGEQLAAGFDSQPGLQAEVLSLLGELYLSVSDSGSAGNALDRAQRLVSTAVVPDSVHARVLLAVSQLDAMKGDFDDALTHARASLALYQLEPDVAPKTIAEVDISIAQALDGKGNNAETAKFLREALARDRDALGDHDDSVAELWLLLGYTLGALGDLDEAANASRRGVEGYRAVYGANGYEVGHALNELALVLALRRDGLGAAEEALRNAVRIYRKVVGEDHQQTMVAERNLLTMVERRGRYLEALPQRESLIARAERPGLSTSRELATQYRMLANDYSQVGRLLDSERALRHSLAMGEKAQGVRDLADQPARADLGVLLTTIGRYGEAESTLREALSIQLELDSVDSLKVKALQASLGELLRLEHRRRAALETLQQATSTVARLDDSDRWRPLALARLSEAQLDMGDVAAAVVTAQIAVDYSRKAFAPDQQENGFALFALARANLLQGHATQAEALLREVLKVRSPPLPLTHPRVLEGKVLLVNALATLDRHDEAETIAMQIRPALAASASPYIAELNAQLAP